MKLFLDIITNPFGLAINVVHWTIAIFAFYMEGNPFDKKTGLCFHCSHLITDLLFMINTIPLIIIQVIGNLFNAVFGMNDFIDKHLIFLFIFIVIAQWFFVGLVINFLIDFHKPKEIKIPLE